MLRMALRTVSVQYASQRLELRSEVPDVREVVIVVHVDITVVLVALLALIEFTKILHIGALALVPVVK